MGTPKVFLSCAAAEACVLTSFLLVDQQDEDSTHKDQREVRWLTTIQSQYDHSSPYTMNLWYRYAKYVANNLTNCYVCSHMPLAVHTPLVRPQPFKNTSSLFPDILSSNYHDAVLNKTVRPLTGFAPPRPPSAGQGNKNFTKYFHIISGACSYSSKCQIYVLHKPEWNSWCRSHPGGGNLAVPLPRNYCSLHSISG